MDTFMDILKDELQTRNREKEEKDYLECSSTISLCVKIK